MASHYQAATLIASPSYPNAIAWSTENLVAVASGHLITILNPSALEGPRELVVLRPSDPFPIGVVNREGTVSSETHEFVLHSFCFSRVISLDG
jgi:hypothetical protein